MHRCFQLVARILTILQICYMRYSEIPYFSAFNQELDCRLIFPKKGFRSEQDQRSNRHLLLTQLHLKEDHLERKPLLNSEYDDDWDYETESDAGSNTGSVEFRDLDDRRSCYDEEDNIHFQLKKLECKMGRRPLTIKPSDTFFELALKYQGVDLQVNKNPMTAFVTRYGLEENRAPHPQSLDREGIWEKDMQKSVQSLLCFRSLVQLKFIDRAKLPKKFYYECSATWQTPPKLRAALHGYGSRPKPDLQVSFNLSEFVPLKHILCWIPSTEGRVIQPSKHEAFLPFVTVESPRRDESEQIAYLKNHNAARTMLFGFYCLTKYLKIPYEDFKSIRVFTAYLDCYSMVIRAHRARKEGGKLRFRFSEISESIRGRRYNQDEAARLMQVVFHFAECFLHPLIQTMVQTASSLGVKEIEDLRKPVLTEF